MKNRLKVLRAERDWSQARLAEELQVSRQTVNAVETGKTDPALSLAFAIARIFEKRIDEIFFPPPPVPKAAPAPVPAKESPAPANFELDITLI